MSEMTAPDHNEENVLEKTGAAIEAVKVMLDAMKAFVDADASALTVAETQFETAFLWAAHGVQGGNMFGDPKPDTKA